MAMPKSEFFDKIVEKYVKFDMCKKKSHFKAKLETIFCQR